MVVEYNVQKTFTNAIDIDDPGNMCLRAMTLDGCSYYIFTKTAFGKVSLMKVGPLLEDIETFLDTFEISYKKFDYKEAAILKEVQLFVNDPRKKILSVDEIDRVSGYTLIPDIAQTFDISADNE